MSIDQYRPFGRTGVKVSPLALGTMMFGLCTELDETVRILSWNMADEKGVPLSQLALA